LSVQSAIDAPTLPELVRDLYQNERSGVLTHRTGRASRQILFSRGLIQLAESSVAEEGLGSRLVRERLVSTGALAEAERDARDPVALGLALVNRGLIAKDTLHRAAREVTAGIVRAVFAEDGGSTEFVEQDEIPQIYEADVPSTLTQILGGFAVLARFHPVREAMWTIANPLRMRHPAPLPLERLVLTRTQGYVLSRVDGTSSLSEVITTLPAGEEEAAVRFLFALLTWRVVEYDPPLGEGPFRAAHLLRDHADRTALETQQEGMVRQAYARVRGGNPYDVLGVTPETNRATIERAYEEAKSLFHRDRLAARIRERFRAELAVIESRLVEAYLHLTQADLGERAADATSRPAGSALDVDSLLVRPELDKTRSRVAQEEATRVAESYHAKARTAMRAGDYHNAIQYAKLAISYHAEDARLYFLLADCQARNPEARWQRMAEENYTRATQLDPWNVDYRISLGRFYKKRGLALRARRQFEEALQLVPDHEVAKHELAELR
jgi:tetratricopeptide (TPR) repeat protein